MEILSNLNELACFAPNEEIELLEVFLLLLVSKFFVLLDVLDCKLQFNSTDSTYIYINPDIEKAVSLITRHYKEDERLSTCKVHLLPIFLTSTINRNAMLIMMTPLCTFKL
ncbi:hypothetical protein L1987_16184 [Smallanthus sonchifolius]|uniref:Uncharacterized protein n=1 Tax=Smallanthus sonchifolius TaxID=185202 RepID=A0ACB9J8M6_9ASTR|nr:hypothetical protein L1987_16184 [Smallanthus sonchifolius]